METQEIKIFNFEIKNKKWEMQETPDRHYAARCSWNCNYRLYRKHVTVWLQSESLAPHGAFEIDSRATPEHQEE